MNVPDAVLAGWSGLAAVWWLIACGLVATGRRRRRPVPASSQPRPFLTVFKALPPVSGDVHPAEIAGALESFVAQLDATSEMLVGVPLEQEALWRLMLAGWARRYPQAQVTAVVLPPPRQRANPKIAWLERLAPSARGELWLWSDADIIAPPDLFLQLDAELESAGADAGAVTAPYCVREITAPPGMVDALFVNAEFLPGALLLGRLGRVKLSFGAAVLFRARDFEARVRWEELGSCLADDYLLGQKLAPVVVSRIGVETCALETRWGSAWRHLYRWQKTILWCRPGSFAALILILPLLGWLVRCVVTPGDRSGWIGLGLQYTADLIALTTLTALISPGLLRRGWGVLLLWPAVRVAGWLAAWIPLPVTWNDPSAPWRTPHRHQDR